jgi:hypothetical protein
LRTTLEVRERVLGTGLQFSVVHARRPLACIVGCAINSMSAPMQDVLGARMQEGGQLARRVLAVRVMCWRGGIPLDSRTLCSLRLFF